MGTQEGTLIFFERIKLLNLVIDNISQSLLFVLNIAFVTLPVADMLVHLKKDKSVISSV